MSEVNYVLIVTAVFFSIASPGPATLTIANISTNYGRVHGSVFALGVATGGLIWSCLAAFGLGAVLYANEWLYEYLRYLGATYLLYLAFKAAYAAIKNNVSKSHDAIAASLQATYFKGLILQLSNPKVILSFASVYAIFLPQNISISELATVIVAITVMANIVFQTYAYIFSIDKVRYV